MSDCNSAIIKNVDAKQIYEVTVGDDDCDGDCENYKENELSDTHVHVSKDDDGNTHGFTVSKADNDSCISYSYYTSNALDVDDIYRMLKEFGF